MLWIPLRDESYKFKIIGDIYKAGTKTIISDKRVYCEILKCNPLQVKEGKEQLKALIEKDKFTKISFVDDEGNEHEIASYDENEFVSMQSIAIVKFVAKKFCYHTIILFLQWNCRLLYAEMCKSDCIFTVKPYS